MTRKQGCPLRNVGHLLLRSSNHSFLQPHNQTVPNPTCKPTRAQGGAPIIVFCRRYSTTQFITQYTPTRKPANFLPRKKLGDKAMAAQTYDNAFCDSIESYLAVYDVLSIAVHFHLTSNYCILGDRTIVRVDMATSSNKEFFFGKPNVTRASLGVWTHFYQPTKCLHAKISCPKY